MSATIDPTPTAVYVAGTARCGSSILSLALNQKTGWCSAGELEFIWERGLNPDKHCACGSTVVSCAFWSAVLSDGLGGQLDAGVDYRSNGALFWGRSAREHLSALEALRRPGLALSSVPGLRWIASDSRRAYGMTQLNVYRSVARMAEADVVVDASKDIGGALALRSYPGDAVLVHLVRDPRAVAYSGLRRPYGGRAERAGKTAAARLALHWLRVNTEIALLKRSWPAQRRLTIRYEDFAANPGATVRRLSTLVAPSVVGGVITTDTHIGDASNHMISAGRARTAAPGERIELDERWRRLPRSEQQVIRAICGIPARRWGYDISLDS